MSLLTADTPRVEAAGDTTRTADLLAAHRVASFERAVREGYFAAMGEASEERLTLGVSPDRVVEHLRDAMRPQHMRPAVAGVLHLQDVALAAACIDEHPAGWAILRDAAERALVRAGASFQSDRNAVLRARRLLAEVAEATREHEGSLDLRRYAGDAPLRAWLVERLMASIARELASTSGGRRSTQGGAADRLESTLRLLRAEAMRDRAPLRRADGDGG